MKPEHMVGAAVMKQSGPDGRYVRISFTDEQFPRADRCTDLQDTLEEAIVAPYVVELDDDMQIHQSRDWTVCKNELREGVKGDNAIKENP